MGLLMIARTTTPPSTPPAIVPMSDNFLPGLETTEEVGPPVLAKLCLVTKVMTMLALVLEGLNLQPLSTSGRSNENS